MKRWGERALCIGGFFVLLMLPGIAGEVMRDRMGVKDLPTWSFGMGVLLGMYAGFLGVYSVVPQRKRGGE